MSRRITQAALAVTAAVAALALSACSSSEAPASATGGDSGKQRTIAFIPGCTCDPYYSTEIAGFEAAAKAAGVTPIVQGPANFQASEQIPVLQAVVQKKPDAIVIDPTDATALAAPITAAVAQGIPVMTTGNNVNSDKIFTAIAASSIQGGKLGAQELMKQKPEGGKVVFVHIKPGISSIDDREKGFREAFAGRSKYTVLPNLYAGNDSATQAAGLVQAAITANPDLVAIFASNVITAEGAANAVRAAGKTGKIAVLGYDASPQEATSLKNGTLTALVSQNPYQIGQLAVKNALKYIEGDRSIPKDQPLVPLVITKDNLDDPASQTALYK
ncbi:substrate-binding domain-containing protein, partial [Nonomuraea sp. RK-328]|nr:substrate-binding domain-containing protein [Nonomuraea sp. RK-328]